MATTRVSHFRPGMVAEIRAREISRRRSRWSEGAGRHVLDVLQSHAFHGAGRAGGGARERDERLTARRLVFGVLRQGWSLEPFRYIPAFLLHKGQ